jgi:hypothetical protein
VTYIERVLKAVDDPVWQEFRKSLKGKDTADKLRLLWVYWIKDQSNTRALQVDNYLKALARGGQLYPGVTFEQFRLETWESIEIRKVR